MSQYYSVSESVGFPMQASHMKQCTENPDLKLQGNKQALVYSGIKDIVKVSSGETSDARTPHATRGMG